MTDNTFEFRDIAGRPAALEINSRDSHMYITWGDLLISDLSGDCGFWASFNRGRSAFTKGAARESALRKHAKGIIEAEIYEQLRFAQQELAPATT